jgi:ABC-type antimicrobial peptide transport system permease subunit
MPSTIQNQIRLPLSVACGVVMQGIRIRLGRAIVTLMGVVLGIAFLMSILTGQTIRQGVSRESEMRSEGRRMLSFLTADIGPVEGRTLGVVALGPLSEMEQRLVNELHSRKVARLRWSGPLPEGADAGFLQPAADPAVGQGAAALLVMGQGAAPETGWKARLAGAEQNVVATTRRLQGLSALPGVVIVCLEREWQPEEVVARSAAARRLRFRTGWVIVISLLVTVIGICNAMLMSVTERFREIGTMKCLGALSQFIREVFFIEACLMGFVGSLAGCLFGIVFAACAYSVSFGFGLVLASLSPGTLLLHGMLCLAAGVVLAVVAAIYPASVASRMVPAAALRSTI